MKELLFHPDFRLFVGYFALGLLVLGVLLIPAFVDRRRSWTVAYFAFSLTAPRVIFLDLRSYAIFAAGRLWLLPLLLSLGMGVALWEKSKEPTIYVSHARMMVKGKFDLPKGTVHPEEVAEFYAMQIEIMQSDEMQRLAAARLSAAHPEWPVQPVRISAVWEGGTTFCLLTASGTEPRYTRAFLDALMAEYIDFKEPMRNHFGPI
jgi:hypothetical protein